MAVRCGTASRYERVRLPSALTHAVVCVASTPPSQRLESATVVPKYVSVTVPRGAAGYVTPAASAGAANSRATTAKTTRRKRWLLGGWLDGRRLDAVGERFEARAVDGTYAAAVEFDGGRVLEPD